MVQIRQATARLRLFLAEISAKEDDLNTLIRQFRTQKERLPRQAIYGRTTLDMVLSAMAEIEERLEHARAVHRHLTAIKRKAEDELVALELTQQVEEAKDNLKQLKASGPTGLSDGELSSEIRRLEGFIAENSKRAEHAITDALRDNEGS